MKYIRTEDGRIFSLSEFKYDNKNHWYCPRQKYLKRENIGFTYWRWCFDDEYDLIPNVLGKITIEQIKREECKFADTIEELCDMFVVEYQTKKKNIFGSFNVACEKYFQCPIDMGGFNLYGAIWVYKGLIYIAKTNDKGELELL